MVQKLESILSGCEKGVVRDDGSRATAPTILAGVTRAAGTRLAVALGAHLLIYETEAIAPPLRGTPRSAR